MNVLILEFLLLSLLTTWVSCCTACLQRIILVLSLWGLVHPWLCELCWTVPFGCIASLVGVSIFSVCWWVCDYGAWQLLGWAIHAKISAGDGKSDASGVSHSCSSAQAWALGDPSVFCRLPWPSSPLPRWIHWIDGSGVRMSGEWSWILLQNAWSPHHWMVVCCQTWLLLPCLWLKTGLSSISVSCCGVSMWQERWTGIYWSNLQWLKICSLSHLERNPYQVSPMVQLGTSCGCNISTGILELLMHVMHHLT